MCNKPLVSILIIIHSLKANNLVYLIVFYVLMQEATVLRDGEKHTLNAEKLVLGDIIFVKFGDRVPADIRVIEAHGFKVNLTICFYFKLTSNLVRI